MLLSSDLSPGQQDARSPLALSLIGICMGFGTCYSGPQQRQSQGMLQVTQSVSFHGDSSSVPILALAIHSAPHVGDGEARPKIYLYYDRLAVMVLGPFVLQTKSRCLGSIQFFPAAKLQLSASGLTVMSYRPQQGSSICLAPPSPDPWRLEVNSEGEMRWFAPVMPGICLVLQKFSQRSVLPSSQAVPYRANQPPAFPRCKLWLTGWTTLVDRVRTHVRSAGAQSHNSRTSLVLVCL